MRMKIFRWKAVGPLALFLVLLAVLLWLFAEPVARSTTEEASTELLGTEVDLARETEDVVISTVISSQGGTPNFVTKIVLHHHKHGTITVERGGEECRG